MEIKNVALNKYSGSFENAVQKPSFTGRATQKLISHILSTQNNKNVKITFDQLVNIYNELGYDVLMKRGSHAIVQINNLINIPIVIPHKDKCVHPSDIKRLKLIIAGQPEKAKLV